MLTASIYVAIMFTLFHTVGAVAGERATFWLAVVAVAALASYVLVRWFNHVNKHEGPMTPLTAEFDHPMPDMPGFEGNPLEKDVKGEQ
jgi:hypothetical protein